MTTTRQARAVLLDESNGIFAYALGDDEELADRFAAFLSAEVDPARVVPLSEAGPARPVAWKSPLAELLNWREHILDERHARLEEAAHAIEQLESLGRLDRVTAAELQHAIGIITRTKLDEVLAEAARGEGR